MKIALIVFDDFTDIDVFLPWDLLNRVAIYHSDWDVRILGTKDVHRSVSGLMLPIHGSVEESKEADVVFFASGPGTRKLMIDAGYLSRFHLDVEQQIVCSICSGALLMAALGLLEGISATTYPTAVKELQSFGVEVVEEPLVVHDNRATAAGCLAVLDLVGWIIERKADKVIRDKVFQSIQPVGQFHFNAL